MPDCPRCHSPGRAVSPRAVAKHAPPSLVDEPEGWYLCVSGTDCSVVYFRGDDVVSVAEMATTPFHKASGADRVVCFCFGHSERDVTDDLRQHGNSALRAAIAEACREGRSDCEALNPEGRCCLGNVGAILKAAAGPPDADPVAKHGCCSTRTASAATVSKYTARATLDALRGWASGGAHSSMFTCYDATMARWLYRGGARVLLVGDSAAQHVLGLDPGARATLGYIATIGAAVKRGAPDAFVVVDYPDELRGSVSNHVAQIRKLADETGADAIKVESDAVALVELLGSEALATIPIVAHLAPREQSCKCCCSQDAGAADGDTLVPDATAVAAAGASAVVLSGEDPSAASLVVDALGRQFPSIPVFGCHCGAECPGQVEMLHDVLALRSGGSPEGVGLAIVEAVQARLRLRSSDV